MAALATTLPSWAVAWSPAPIVWRVFFSAGSSELHSYPQHVVQQTVAERKNGECPLKVILTGYVDGAEARSAPIDLDIQRAQAVADYIKLLGNPHWIYSVRGESNARPVEMNRLGTPSPANRRVELRFDNVGASGRVECTPALDDASPSQCTLVMADGTRCTEGLAETDLWTGHEDTDYYAGPPLTDRLMTVGATVSFPPGSSDLTDEAGDAIEAFLMDRNKSCPFTIEVIGHVDGAEARAAPPSLDTDRARVVARHLRDLGATAWTIKTEGRHVSEQLATTGLGIGAHANRRVEIRYAPILASGELECAAPIHDRALPKCALVLDDGTRCDGR